MSIVPSREEALFSDAIAQPPTERGTSLAVRTGEQEASVRRRVARKIIKRGMVAREPCLAAPLTRRRLLQSFATAGAMFMATRSALAGAVIREKRVPAKFAADHLIVGAADLDHAKDWWFERLTGVKPASGGVHPGRGTRNALVSLGGRQYIEIIAADPAQTTFGFQIDVRKLTAPRMIAWAAATHDIVTLAERGRVAGVQLAGPVGGSRARPDGKTLKWKTLGVVTKLNAGFVHPIPFFIEWSADSLHPSLDSPAGCELLSFEIEHPDPASVVAMLNTLGVEAKVKPAKEAGFRVRLKTPKGTVELSYYKSS